MLFFPGRRRVPSFKDTVAALGDSPAYIYQALEHGSERCRSFFHDLSDKETPRPHLREMIVRDGAKRFLEKNAFIVGDDHIEMANEPMAAVLLRLGAIQIRILKGPEGTVPGCGTSDRRREYYSQKPGIYIANGVGSPTKLNLVLLWDFDPHFNIGNVWLCCPVGAGATPSEVRCRWHEPLSHPALTVSPARTQNDEQRDEQEIEQMLRNSDKSEESEDEASQDA